MVADEYKAEELEIINFKKRTYVRQLTNRAVQKRELIRSRTCELCGKDKKIEAHHIDYGKPMQVTWVCKKCHIEVHKPQHALNPKNNPQSPMPYIVNEYKKITISFEIPVDNYLALIKQSEIQQKSINQITRECIQNEFPVYNPQLQLFKKEYRNDKPQDVSNSRIQSMEANDRLRKQQKNPILFKIRRKRNNNMRGMEKQFYSILK